MAEFCFEATRRVVVRTLYGYRAHPDFEDIVQEAVLAAWRAKKRQPGYSYKRLAQRAARWQLGQWFRSGKCGDIIKPISRGQLRYTVEPFPEWRDEMLSDPCQLTPEQLEARLIWNDFFAGPVKPHYLEALRLIYQEGMPFYLAAKAVGITHQSLDKGVKRAFRKYRGKLDA